MKHTIYLTNIIFKQPKFTFYFLFKQFIKKNWNIVIIILLNIKEVHYNILFARTAILPFFRTIYYSL